MTRSSALLVALVALLTLPLACDKSQPPTTTAPSEDSAASSEPAPEPAPNDGEVASEDALDDEALWGELTEEELAEMDAELDAELDAGTESIGSGSGYGQGGFGGSDKAVPQITQAKATVDGNLDSDIIRRIVRAHINEVRSCYNAGLTKDPSLAGRVTIAFTIAASGKVSASQGVDSDDFADPAVVECIATVVKRWIFPKPRAGGEVEVTYPFVLAPG